MLRRSLTPRSTLAGFRPWVVTDCPVPASHWLGSAVLRPCGAPAVPYQVSRDPRDGPRRADGLSPA